MSWFSRKRVPHASGDYPERLGGRSAVIPTSVALPLEPHAGFTNPAQHFLGDWARVGHAPTPLTERAAIGVPRQLFAPPLLHQVLATGEEFYSKATPEWAFKIQRSRTKQGLDQVQLVAQTAGVSVLGVTH
jgi:hypothetical protein